MMKETISPEEKERAVFPESSRTKRNHSEADPAEAAEREEDEKLTDKGHY